MESSRGCSRTGLLPEGSLGSPNREMEREERAKGRLRGEKEKASWERGKQDDKTEKKMRARSVKESEMRSQSLKACVGKSLIYPLVSQHASQTAKTGRNTWTGCDGKRGRRAGHWLCAVTQKQVMFPKFGFKRMGKKK